MEDSTNKYKDQNEYHTNDCINKRKSAENREFWYVFLIISAIVLLIIAMLTGLGEIIDSYFNKLLIQLYKSKMS